MHQIWQSKHGHLSNMRISHYQKCIDLCVTFRDKGWCCWWRVCKHWWWWIKLSIKLYQIQDSVFYIDSTGLQLKMELLQIIHTNFAPVFCSVFIWLRISHSIQAPQLRIHAIYLDQNGLVGSGSHWFYFTIQHLMMSAILVLSVLGPNPVFGMVA